ncbi:MAG: penicillin-binding transpeptidase domain-containing protein [Anaerovoracaceae bacterium]
MNKKNTDSRFYQIVGLILVLMIILAVRLFILTILQEESWAAEASTQSVREIYTPAPRGDILDRYGRVIATNKQSFAVTFNSTDLTTEQINASTYELINTLIKYGDKYTDNFPIKISKTGEFTYTYKTEIAKWLNKQNFPQDATANQAFQMLRKKYNISPKLSRYDAYDELEKEHGISAPIHVKNSVYSSDVELENFLLKFGFLQEDIDKGISAEEAFKQLRIDYNIDKSLSDAEARKIFIIRNEIATMSYSRYLPIKIASDVSDRTIAYFEEMNIPGVEIVSERNRYYPNKNMASHILGYMGSISESEAEYYVGQLGYTASDLVGKDGIESKYETDLKGKDGVKKIEVNSGGEYMSTLSEEKPQKGKDVYLTIDLDLQKTAEDALSQMINCVSNGGVFRSEYGNVGAINYGNCKSGAVVALEVGTSNVLAMANFPDYDPNIFANGISEKAWASVQSKNPRDLMAPIPLYNSATKASVQPGSTFKPLTSVAALECGLNPNRVIYDKGYVDVGDKTWGCSSWNDYGGNHGNITMETGIGYSCNYYFYCIGTGRDYSTGASLGYKQKISVDKIMSVAREFGLGDETGIEIDEETTPLASAGNKQEQMKIALWNDLYSRSAIFFPSKVVGDYDRLTKNIDTITNWIYKNPSRDQLISYIDEQTDVKDSQVEAVADICKYSYFNMAQWTLGDEFNIAIGQGDNAYTPLQMANYIATIGNKGIRNTVSVVKGVEGIGTNNKPAGKQIDLPNTELLNHVIKGMKKVASGGTLAGIFGNFKYDVAAKTGTAEKAGVINPKNEVAYIKQHLSGITSSVSWAQVQKSMKKLMKDNPEQYTTGNNTVDVALIQASKGRVTQAMIDNYKPTYDNFAWTVAMAPADNPKIAVVVMLVQGGTSYNAAPIAREVIGKYLDSSEKYDTISFSNKMQ